MVETPRRKFVDPNGWIAGVQRILFGLVNERPGPEERSYGILRRLLSSFTYGRLLVAGGLMLVALLWLAVATSYISVYPATVFVSETSHGIAPPGEPFDFGDLPPSAAIEHKITLKNAGRIDTYVLVMVIGGISDFVEIDESFILVKREEEGSASVKVSIPLTAATEQRHGGWAVMVRIPFGLPW